MITSTIIKYRKPFILLNAAILAAWATVQLNSILLLLFLKVSSPFPSSSMIIIEIIGFGVTSFVSIFLGASQGGKWKNLLTGALVMAYLMLIIPRVFIADILGEGLPYYHEMTPILGGAAFLGGLLLALIIGYFELLKRLDILDTKHPLKEVQTVSLILLSSGISAIILVFVGLSDVYELTINMAYRKMMIRFKLYCGAAATLSGVCLFFAWVLESRREAMNKVEPHES